MKTKAIYILGALAVLGACQAKEEWGENKEQIRLSLAGDIEQLAVTRASANAFADGDQVGIYAVNYDGDTPGTLALKGNQATNVRFTFDGTSAWTPDYDIYYKDKNTKVDIYGYYPYSSAISSVSEWPFEVQEDQSTVSAHGNMGGYEASDFLWAKREAVVPTANAIQLLFQHKMSCVVVSLVKGTGFTDEEFAALSKSVLVNNVRRNATINLATGVVTATGAVPARSTVPASYDGGFRAIVVPQTVSSDATLFSITLGGVAYTYSENAAFTYLPGKQHNFAVTVDKKGEEGYSVSVSTSISAWTNDNSSHDFTAKEYVVVNVETPGTLGETLTHAGKDPNAIKYLKVLGTVSDEDIYFIRDNMSVVQGINMLETKVDNGIIPNSAFGGLQYLSSFIFPDGNHNNSITVISSSAFSGVPLTGALTIPEGVTTIGSDAFRNCRITQLSLPESLESIGATSFYNCSLITGGLNLPRNIKSIESSAFDGCSGLTGTLVLPDGIETIGSSAFSFCTGFTGELIIPGSLQIVDEGSFYACSGFSSLTLKEGITDIKNSGFGGCSGMKGELILPSTLKAIGNLAFTGCNFSGKLVFPESLIMLGTGAFLSCGRLSGVLEIPETITYLSGGVFRWCNSLEGLILPSSLDVIEEGAFEECTSLSSIVCKATAPPTLIGDVFNGVPKDNFAIEVPEASVSDYSYAIGWNEFQRISAHQEFSISRRLYRLLNPSESRTFVLSAESGKAWTVESQPSWVTVTPSSGTGKTDITVTVNPLGTGAGNRNGEVVFLLDGKDYRSTLIVEQYDYTYGDGSVITQQSHTSGAGIPLVFLGDCYDAADIAGGNYLSDIENAIDYFFDIEPYKTYKNYFDVYVVFGKSEDSGVGSINTVKEAKFGTQYSLTGGSLENNGAEAFQYAKFADAEMDLAKALVVMVLNSTDYGGVTYMWNDGSAIAVCPKSTDPYPYDFRGLVQHEAGGHGFGKLGDEYIYVNAFIQACGCNNPHLPEFRASKTNGWYKNLSETGNRDLAPWAHLMNHPSYSNTVDIYEGGFFHTRGIFRSESNSCMNNNIPYYSAISRQAIVERIKAYAGESFDLEDFYANDAAALLTKAPFLASPSWTPSTGSGSVKQHSPVLMGDHPVLNN